jgi:hypothetical protein
VVQSLGTGRSKSAVAVTDSVLFTGMAGPPGFTPEVVPHAVSSWNPGGQT